MKNLNIYREGVKYTAKFTHIRVIRTLDESRNVFYSDEGMIGLIGRYK